MWHHEPQRLALRRTHQGIHKRLFFLAGTLDTWRGRLDSFHRQRYCQKHHGGPIVQQRNHRTTKSGHDLSWKSCGPAYHVLGAEQKTLRCRQLSFTGQPLKESYSLVNRCHNCCSRPNSMSDRCLSVILRCWKRVSRRTIWGVLILNCIFAVSSSIT